jgi:NAD(P)-dependent dehydrogenase (short-subunit alcohol dehydrogenase family)
MIGAMTGTGLKGRTVVVTGGAGGTGAAISRAFAAEGALDLGSRGMRVDAVAPGPVQTGWMTWSNRPVGSCRSAA